MNTRSLPLPASVAAAVPAAFSAVARPAPRRGLLAVALFFLAQASAQAALVQPMLAVGGLEKLKNIFAGILYLVMAIGLIFGIIKVIQGALALTQGEQGWGQIIGGALIAAAPIIMNFAFDIGGLGGMTISNSDISAAGSGATP